MCPRDEVAEALWREPDPAAVDARLNPLLSKLRRVFGAESVDGRSALRLCLPDAWVDLEAAAEAIHRAESAVAQREWARGVGARADRAVRRRARFPARRGRALDRRDPPPAGRTAPARPRELRGGDPGPWRHRADRRGAGRAAADPPCPLRESGYRYLMRALAAQDNLAEALGVYSQLSECLREQLGVSPSPATRALYEELLATT